MKPPLLEAQARAKINTDQPMSHQNLLFDEGVTCEGVLETRDINALVVNAGSVNSDKSYVLFLTHMTIQIIIFSTPLVVLLVYFYKNLNCKSNHGDQ